MNGGYITIAAAPARNVGRLRLRAAIPPFIAQRIYA
jgi:hypothetical protein